MERKETLEEVAERLYPIKIESCMEGKIDVNSYERNLFIEGAKWQAEQQLDTSNVTRVEVIQHSEPYNGRAYTKRGATDVEIQFQDDGKTLKIFLK